MEENWLKKMSQEQLEAMLQDIQNEIENRQITKRAQAWEKVKAAIEEYLEFSSITVSTPENIIYIESGEPLDMDTFGSIAINYY